MVVHVRTVVRLLAPLLLAATLLVPASAPADSADLDGCDVLPARTTATWASTRSDGEVACVRVRYPSWATVRAVVALGESSGGLSVVDAEGAEVCDARDLIIDTCRLSGPRPLHLVRTGGPVDTVVNIALARLDEPAGCTPLGVGVWGTADGTVVGLDPGQVATCLSVPTRQIRRNNVILWERAAGDDVVEVVMRSDRTGACPGIPVPAAADHGSLSCSRHPSNEVESSTTQVLLRSAGVGSEWLVARRVPGVSPGCGPAASTVPGGAATLGTVTSFVAVDCVAVPAKPTDRFVVDAVDDGADLAVQAYGADGGETCPGLLPVTDPCQVDLEEEHFVTLGAPGPLDQPAAYALDTWKVETLRGWVPQCTRLDDYTGSFTRSGVLDDDHTGECVVLEDGGAAQYTFDTAQAVGVALSLVPAGGPPEEPRCEAESSTSRTCIFVGGAHDDTGVMLVRRDDGADREALPYEVGVDCLQPGWCESLPWTPTAPPVIDGPLRVGDELSATTGAWSPSQPDGFRYLWLVDGVPVRADTVLAPETVGREVRVRVQATQGSIADGDAALSAPVTVRPGPAPVLVDEPELRGGRRVGRLAGVSRGTWEPEARTSYRWRVGDRLLGETGRRIWLKPWMRGSRLTVREVARVPGLRPARTVVGAFRVRRR